MVCGPRTWRSYARIKWFLAALNAEYKHLAGIVVIHGDAKGADKMAGRAARELGIPVEAYPVEEREWKMFGHAAPLRRTDRIIEDQDIDLVVSFGTGRGTNYTIKKAEERWKPIVMRSRDVSWP